MTQGQGPPNIPTLPAGRPLPHYLTLLNSPGMQMRALLPFGGGAGAWRWELWGEERGRPGRTGGIPAEERDRGIWCPNRKIRWREAGETVFTSPVFPPPRPPIARKGRGGRGGTGARGRDWTRRIPFIPQKHRRTEAGRGGAAAQKSGGKRLAHPVEVAVEWAWIPPPLPSSPSLLWSRPRNPPAVCPLAAPLPHPHPHPHKPRLTRGQGYPRDTRGLYRRSPKGERRAQGRGRGINMQPRLWPLQTRAGPGGAQKAGCPHTATPTTHPLSQQPRTRTRSRGGADPHFPPPLWPGLGKGRVRTFTLARPGSDPSNPRHNRRPICIPRRFAPFAQST